MSDKTRLVACTHASNILGTIHDIRGFADVVHSVPGVSDLKVRDVDSVV